VPDSFSLQAGLHIDVKMRRVVFERIAKGRGEVIDIAGDGLGRGRKAIGAASI
jgi:hypothetical protein